MKTSVAKAQLQATTHWAPIPRARAVAARFSFATSVRYLLMTVSAGADLEDGIRSAGQDLFASGLRAHAVDRLCVAFSRLRHSAIAAPNGGSRSLPVATSGHLFRRALGYGRPGRR